MLLWIGFMQTCGAGQQVSRVEIAESRAEGADIEVLVGIADTSGNSSLRTLAAQIEQGPSARS